MASWWSGCSSGAGWTFITISSPQAHEDIIRVADAVVFSRGNLGVCLDAEKVIKSLLDPSTVCDPSLGIKPWHTGGLFPGSSQVFLAQKSLLRACNLAGKPVFVNRVIDTMTGRYGRKGLEGERLFDINASPQSDPPSYVYKLSRTISLCQRPPGRRGPRLPMWQTLSWTVQTGSCWPLRRSGGSTQRWRWRQSRTFAGVGEGGWIGGILERPCPSSLFTPLPLCVSLAMTPTLLCTGKPRRFLTVKVFTELRWVYPSMWIAVSL